jgi:thioredoxin reductase (NADPH)
MPDLPLSASAPPSPAGIQADDETLAPALNQETFETNVPDLFLASGCVAGKATGNIFIENGRFHGQTIVNVIADRLGRVE